KKVLKGKGNKIQCRLALWRAFSHRIKNMKIKLIVEDYYGVSFFINVIERLKQANLVNKNLIIPKPKHLPADCNQKLDMHK
ncbi:MAG: hypothetical protein O8C59_03425, partial [Candidatus Methanoperedens sp.]|nr:hypothetical protein [Candidatus Methanoperedens sp.]